MRRGCCRNSLAVLWMVVVVVMAMAYFGCVSEYPTGEGVAQYALVDMDGDGINDAIDLDVDGFPDLDMESEAGGVCDEPLVDNDGNGFPDGIDTSCNGQRDCVLCSEPLIDEDGDGVADGLDFDCDGHMDLRNSTREQHQYRYRNGGPVGDCIMTRVYGDGSCGYDIDCDGETDFSCTRGCAPGPVDEDGDMVPEGLDCDCDSRGDMAMSRYRHRHRHRNGQGCIDGECTECTCEDGCVDACEADTCPGGCDNSGYRYRYRHEWQWRWGQGDCNTCNDRCAVEGCECECVIACEGDACGHRYRYRYRYEYRWRWGQGDCNACADRCTVEDCECDC